ncbi:HNH endonuclease [Plantibacter sp. MPB07]|uniref:HNH endonuclease n=1 Tax=Plantibacter sp. MPB07 TaxID=3388853 RepID=UPI0039886BEE
MVTHLTPLAVSGQSVRDQCMLGMLENDRKLRLLADLPNVAREEMALRDALSSGRHRDLVPVFPVTDDVKSDMAWLYSERFRDSPAARDIWLRIVGLAGRRCPFCHISKPKTVEHSFPKSRYPRIAVDPWNMVPACRDCNFERNTGSGSISISPYFDTWLVSNSWLVARVLDPGRPEDLQFSAVRHPSFTDDQWHALNEFVDDVDLFDRYVGLAIEAFSEFAVNLREAYRVPTVADATVSLNDRVSSHLLSFGINRWQTVAYQAWQTAVHSIDWITAGQP